MNDFLISAFTIAMAEIGDKTQLLSLCMVACYRRPLYIIIGILLATTLNHALAGAIGHALGGLLSKEPLQWVTGISLLLTAAWVLVPDRNNFSPKKKSKWGVVLAAFTAFFIAEIGDKTQVATMVLAAQAISPVQVVLGTTLGMMIANVPVILFGERIMRHVPLNYIRYAAAAVFAALAVYTLGGVIIPLAAGS